MWLIVKSRQKIPEVIANSLVRARPRQPSSPRVLSSRASVLRTSLPAASLDNSCHSIIGLHHFFEYLEETQIQVTVMIQPQTIEIRSMVMRRTYRLELT